MFQYKYRVEVRFEVGGIRCMCWKSYLGLAPNKDEKEFIQSFESSGYETLRVEGRGTISVSAKEIRESPEYKKYSDQAEKLFSEQVN